MLLKDVKIYAVIGASLLYVALLVGAASVGYRVGTRDVQAAWDKEKKALLGAQLGETEGALKETRRLAKEAGEKYQEDLAAAIKAAEERQSARVDQAVRQAAIDAVTRQGQYVSPECVVDSDTFKKLQDQLGKKK